MSRKTLIHVRCSNCNNIDLPDAGETEEEVFELMAYHKWACVKVPNGSMWDLCPKCHNYSDEAVAFLKKWSET